MTSAISMTSRTAYVLLAAMEEDLRNLLAISLGDASPAQALGEELTARAAERRTKDGKRSSTEHVPALLPYLDFQDSFDALMRNRSILPEGVQAAASQLHRQALRVVPVRNRVAHSRPLELDDLPIVVDFSAQLVEVEGFDWAQTREIRQELEEDPSKAFQTTSRLIITTTPRVAHNLPGVDFDETSLLGRKDERRQVLRALNGAWPVVSILGDGGIGKSALALQVCYDLADKQSCPFEAIVWVSAKNSRLTLNEIQRIETAIEDSLGLFASAVAEVGEDPDPEHAVDQLLDVMRTFPMLLVLDNVETVLDDHLPTFLRDIPKESKVLITSRIGVRTENPIKLTGLSEEDSVKLIRILGRTRGIEFLLGAPEAEVHNWVRRMKCHPAHIKWFVSGIQAGQTPERLLANNGLVLDFCMSNVFEYLSADARAVLRSMLVVSGSHNLAELAFLNDLDAATTNKVVLELTTTNFLSIVRGGSSGTALQLSDFARAYLRKNLSIEQNERDWLTARQHQLYSVGGALTAAHARNPFAADTIDVRGVGDYSAARYLREAIDLAQKGRHDAALKLCGEASELDAGYHEVARITGYVHELAMNYTEANEAYLTARELAPEDPHILYFLGQFQVHSGYDPRHGLQELQRAAGISPASYEIQSAVASAHEVLGDHRAAAEASLYMLRSLPLGSSTKLDVVFSFLRFSARVIEDWQRTGDWAAGAEWLEVCLATLEDLDPDELNSFSLDYCLLLGKHANTIRIQSSDRFISAKAAQYEIRLLERRRRVDSGHLDRRLGTVKNLVVNSGYGFINDETGDVFFHLSRLWDKRYFDELSIGSVLAYNLAKRQGDKVQAEQIFWVG